MLIIIRKKVLPAAFREGGPTHLIVQELDVRPMITVQNPVVSDANDDATVRPFDKDFLSVPVLLDAQFGLHSLLISDAIPGVGGGFQKRRCHVSLRFLRPDLMRRRFWSLLLNLQNS